MIQTLEICSTAMENDQASPLFGMAAKALAQLQSHNETVTAEAVDWKDKYEQMGRLYSELDEKIGDLAEENEQLLIKCKQLEVDESMLNDMLTEKINDLADENKKLECELVSNKTLFEASPMQDTSPTITNSFSFSGDVYAQLDQFEDSLDMELEDFQLLGLWNENNTSANNSEDVETTDSESEQKTLEITKDILFITPAKNPLQDKTLETIKDTPRAPNRYPLQLLHRMFQTQTQDVYDAVPAMIASDSLMSLSSDYSISTISSSDLLSLTPTKKTMKMPPQPNYEWAIIE
jgi:hypothetical protein